jgi:hypothetical protein
MTQFEIEHYETIVAAWLVAAAALAVVSAFAFGIAFGPLLLKRRAAAPRAAEVRRPMVAEPARPRPEVTVAGTPVGAV